MMVRLNRLICVALCMFAVGGCSYRPLYGTASEDRGVVEALATIAIPEAETRLGQIIRNDLLSAMRPAGTAGDDRFQLRLTTVQGKDNIIKRLQPNETRDAVKASVSFELLDGDKMVYSGKTFSQVTFDVVRQPFADTQAENNATERVAHELSADIRTRLAAYFASR